MKVNRDIKPCHNPIKNPAGSISNFSFPAAQDDKNNTASTTTGSHLR
jgi:hypothetical protein